MVSFTTTALLSLAAIGALAAPAVEKRTGIWKHEPQCMSDSDAQQVADNYAELIRSYSTKLANEALAVDFVDYSESVNTLINTCPQGSAAVTLPLLSASFNSRAQFEKGQSQQPAIDFTQLLLEHNCKSVTIRWETTNTAPIPNPRPVVGLILIEAEKAPAGNKYPWIVKTVYSEFDSGAWLQNLEQAGICSAAESGSPTIIIPASSGAAATSTAVVASASTYVAPSASATVVASSAGSSNVASTVAGSSYTASTAAASSYAASTAAASSYAASATASAYATSSASA